MIMPRIVLDILRSGAIWICSGYLQKTSWWVGCGMQERELMISWIWDWLTQSLKSFIRTYSHILVHELVE